MAQKNVRFHYEENMEIVAFLCENHFRINEYSTPTPS